MLVVLAGCSGAPDPEPTDASSDAGPSDAAPDSPAMCVTGSNAAAARPSPDGEGWCCQPGFPTCDCGYFGGFVAERCDCDVITGAWNSPFGLCDLHPYDWVLGTDAHGCARYSARPPSGNCCNCPWDMGGPVDDAGVDDASVDDAGTDDAAVDDASAPVADAAIDAP